ncbi:cysteine hydrolase family protein [Nocardia donostiensis]|uniref:Cysteine hydrolase n=1 Tax=Nocardia donostiensis TaxID=1538463 RepID=A0A1V2THL8_9NOCA|nr:cysteine hydrolase [Nocardia donostiensis]ONM49010.1 cysteine hydrolase [Nocardia donostiensis]OQS14027.1 cysteine hydrolase [Nocardia donostiensis]OQS19490.1 cysteine hydrolase [Nocardia donostiensis]
MSDQHAAVLALHWQVNVIRPEGFFGPMLAEPVAATGVVQRAAQFHADAAAIGLPVIFTRFTVPEDEGKLVTNTGFMLSVAAAQQEFRPEAPGSQLIEEMADQPSAVFDNQKLSGLAGSGLLRWLAENDIDTLFLTGVATNLTVEQTARHATDLGFTVHTVADCVAAASPEVHAASLANLTLATSGPRTAADALEISQLTGSG